MIESISLTGLKASPKFGYAAELPFFKGRRVVKFKPGLNILYGGNGTGKSTVLNILGDTLCARQSGVSVVTYDALDSSTQMGRGRGRSISDAIRLSVKHDGQPLVYLDPRNSVGLRHGAFDDDFMGRGLQEIFGGRGLSTGQNALRRGTHALQVVTGKVEPPSAIEYKVGKKELNGFWAEKFAIVEKHLEATIPKGQLTVVLDEPEAGYSFEWQAQLWNTLGHEKVTSRVQVIVASHSPFALGIKNANYIEVEEGSVERASAALVDLATRLRKGS